ncbi:MAG: response regulator [Candidatus Omnitrophota bacterium]|nr:response regulator [Candidatus Omnitrophota bacterium]
MSTATEVEKAYILVIDDDPLVARSLRKVLEGGGYFVDVAMNGHEGIRKAKSGFFHLVLCDLKMPGLDGIMTMKHIQEFQEKAGIGQSGFIVITAYDTDEHRKSAFQLGVTDFLQKPFDLTKFLEVIEHSVTPLLKEVPVTEVKRLNRRLDRLLKMRTIDKD